MSRVSQKALALAPLKQKVKKDVFGWKGTSAVITNYPPPEHCDIPASEFVHHVATLQTLPLSKLLDGFPDAASSAIAPVIDATDKALDWINTGLQNVTIVYRSHFVDYNSPSGWYLEASTVIDESWGAIFEFLHDTLGLKSKTACLKLRLQLASETSTLTWDTPLQLKSFVIEGLLADMDAVPFEHVHLTTVGVRLIAYQKRTRASSAVGFGFGVFGALRLDVGKGAPLTLTSDMTVIAGVASLFASLQGDIWNDALGIKGLTLVSTTFSGSFSLKPPFQPTVAITAALVLGRTRIAFTGSYSKSDASLSTYVENLDWKFLDSIFFSLSGEHLQKPDFEFKLGSGWIELSTARGLTISVQNLVIDEYTIAEATLLVDKEHIAVSGSLGRPIKYHHLVLVDACLAVDISWKRKDVMFMLHGEIIYEGVRFIAGVQLERTTIDGVASWEYLLYGSVSSKELISTGSLFSTLKGTCADVTLTDVAIMIASTRAPKASDEMKVLYPAREGIQVCAKLTSSKALASFGSITGKSQMSLVLMAGYSFQQKNFLLTVNAPDLGNFEIAPGIKTKSFELLLQPDVIKVIGKVVITVQRDSLTQYLECGLDVGISTTAVGGGCSMDSDWKNPFGVGDHIVLSKLHMAIAFSVAGGSPVLFFAGALSVGTFQGSLQFQISQSPADCFIDVSAKNINLGDIASLAPSIDKNVVAQLKELLAIETFKLYICPRRMTILATAKVQEAGISFYCDCIILDHRAHISGTVSSAPPAIKFKGAVDNFEIGPVRVRSASGGPQAIIDFRLSPSECYILIDGAVDVFSLTAAAIVRYDGSQFYMKLNMNIDSRFKFELEGYTSGTINIYKRSTLDFYLHAHMEQKIDPNNNQTFVEYVMTSIKRKLEDALRNEARDIFQTVLSTKQISNALMQLPRDERRRVIERAIDLQEQTAVQEAARNMQRPNQSNFDQFLNVLSAIPDVVTAHVARLAVSLDDGSRMAEDISRFGDCIGLFGTAMVETADAIRDVNIVPPVDILLFDVEGSLRGAMGLDPKNTKGFSYSLEYRIDKGAIEKAKGSFNVNDMNSFLDDTFKQVWKEVKDVLTSIN